MSSFHVLADPNRLGLGWVDLCDLYVVVRRRDRRRRPNRKQFAGSALHQIGRISSTMVRLDVELPEGFKLVLGQDAEGTFMRVLADENGRPTYITPRTPMNLGWMKAYLSDRADWPDIEVGECELSLRGSRVELKVPTWKTISADRKRFADVAEKFVACIETDANLDRIAELRSKRLRQGPTD